MSALILTDWLWSSLMVLAIVCLIVMWINCRKYAKDVFVIYLIWVLFVCAIGTFLFKIVPGTLNV